MKNRAEYQKEYRKKNKIKITLINKTYNKKNKNKRAIGNKKYYEENKENILEHNKLYQKNNQIEIKKTNREYRKSNQISISKKKKIYIRNKRKTDLSFRLRSNVSRTISLSLKKFGSSKNGQSTVKYLPYPILDLKHHLESQFESWMTWENWGVYNLSKWNDNDQSTWSWQIDHIIPQSSLPYSSMEEENFKICWSLNNLRPYSAKQNVIDGNRR